jgi:signal transduction histidine kinase
MTIAVFVAHLIVLPILYLAVVVLLTQSNEDQYINYVRGYSRFVADSLEHVRGETPEQQISDILDGFMLSGFGVTAEIEANQRTYRGTLNPDSRLGPRTDDFSISEHDDEIYHTSTPLMLLSSAAVLRLGFDEGPVNEKNKSTYVRTAIILGIYWLIILILVALIGRRVTRPIRALQVASRNVASGQFSEHLTVESDLVEFVELSGDLELMRSKLMGVNEQLQREIRDREKTEKARALLESQLQHKQRLETVGTLAGGIAHELNNILLPIILYSEMAIEDLPVAASTRSDIERVLRAANRAKLIVSQVLIFSRQIDERQLEEIDLVESIVDSLDLMRPAMPPNILLIKEIGLERAVVLADKSSVGQLIVNLLTNAYQSMLELGGTLRVGLSEIHSKKTIQTFQTELAPGHYFVLCVEDTGGGIPATTLERIFEPFYSTRGIGEGTGLGLSVVHGIVSSLQGGISVKSKPNVGSRFDVYLPTADSNAAFRKK